MTASPKDSKRQGEVRMIPIEQLQPHPLNANTMLSDRQEKLKAHIKQSGRYPHIIVRPHPDQDDCFQILDGHHRIEVLRDLGHPEVRCDLWEVSDREARVLLATLNRLEGQDVPVRRAQLIHELLGEMRLDDLAGLLPEDERQIEDLHSLLEFPADEVAELLDEQAEEEERVLPRVLTFVVTHEQEQRIEQAVELASDGTPGRDRRARGLANLAQHYMESRDGESQQEA